MNIENDNLAASAASPARAQGRLLGNIALAAAVISLGGFAVLVIGHVVDPGDFNNGKNPSPANNVAFVAYILGLLVALGLGGAVWSYGRRARRTGPRSSAAIATYYGVAALVVGIFAAILGA